MKKERVDVLAVQQGLFETREQAKRGVMAGLVYTNQVKKSAGRHSCKSKAKSYLMSPVVA